MNSVESAYKEWKQGSDQCGIIGLFEPYPLGYENERPWGHFEDIYRSNKYVLKTLHVKPGCKLSLQYHNEREEIWKIVKGEARIYQEIQSQDYPGEGVWTIGYPGDVIQIGVMDIHRLENPGKDELIVLELQTGNCKEDDIVRLEDDWGRA